MTRRAALIWLALFAAPAAAQVTEADLAGEWRVVEFAGEAVPADQVASLSFAEGRVAGRSICNRYTAAFTISGDRLAIGPAAGTRMACPPPLMALEARFLDVLGKVSTATIRDGRLVLTAPDGRTIIARRG